MAISPNQRFIAISHQGVVTIYDEDMQHLGAFGASMQRDPVEIVWSGETLFAFDMRSGEIRQFRPEPKSCVEWHQDGITTAAISPEGTFVAFGLKNGSVAVYRASDKKLMQSVLVNGKDMQVQLVHFLNENEFIARNTNGDITRYTVR